MRVREIDLAGYEEVVESAQSTVYHDPAFLSVLRDVLEDSRLVLLGLFEGERLGGAIPCFIKKTDLGSVLNSLPFHGSNGGCLLASGRSRSAEPEGRRALLRAVVDLAKENDCLSSTIISSPLDSDDGYYRALFQPNSVLDRVAQILELPESERALMETFGKKCRNSIRRAIADGVKVTWDATMDSLHEVDLGQQAIMKALNASPRPTSFFEAVARRFKAGDGYRVYRASLGDSTVGLLLALYHKGRSVEYQVPVVYPENRRHSPMNLIVFQAASDAIRAGYKEFSFGGTRPGQIELHRFKESFGAADHPYHYFVKAHQDLKETLALGEQEMSSKFRWFFVAPLPPRGS